MKKGKSKMILINENVAMFQPSLAVKYGVHGAIVLQQIHYWVNHVGPDGRRYGEEHDGVRWIHNTIKEWQETNFVYLSESQVWRAVKKLESSGVIITRNDLNKFGYDRTKWYSVNYEVLRNREMEVTPMKSGNHANAETIPETSPKDYPNKEKKRKVGSDKSLPPDSKSNDNSITDNYLEDLKRFMGKPNVEDALIYAKSVGADKQILDDWLFANDNNWNDKYDWRKHFDNYYEDRKFRIDNKPPFEMPDNIADALSRIKAGKEQLGDITMAGSWQQAKSQYERQEV
jgi:DNA-binding Lrp family transcriptional regulator